MGSECNVCGGHLRTLRAAPHKRNVPMGWEPCARCLTTPATDEIREVAREWMGFDPWDVLAMETSGPITASWWDNQWRPVIPAYLGMGRALLCEVLARREGLPTWGGASFRQHGKHEWTLTGSPPPKGMTVGTPAMDETQRRYCAVRPPHAHTRRIRGTERLWIEVPALAAIPEEAPHELRRDRALVLAVEAINAE